MSVIVSAPQAAAWIQLLSDAGKDASGHRATWREWVRACEYNNSAISPPPHIGFTWNNVYFCFVQLLIIFYQRNIPRQLIYDQYWFFLYISAQYCDWWTITCILFGILWIYRSTDNTVQHSTLARACICIRKHRFAMILTNFMPCCVFDWRENIRGCFRKFIY